MKVKSRLSPWSSCLNIHVLYVCSGGNNNIQFEGYRYLKRYETPHKGTIEYIHIYKAVMCSQVYTLCLGVIIEWLHSPQ